MERHAETIIIAIVGTILHFFRTFLSVGPMPNHIAFIMDGNRRYGQARGYPPGAGHRAAFSTLISILCYCYGMGVKFVTVYAFSIDNFRRDPAEVQLLMDLIEEKLIKLTNTDSFVSKYNCRVNFWGNMDLLSKPVREAANKLAEHTARNNGTVLSVCIAYTSADEIVNAVTEVVEERRDEELLQPDLCNAEISVAEFERHLYSAGCPDPDIVIRTSGETRLSNFLLWQSAFSHLQNPSVLWPGFSFWHLIWAILQYQRAHPFLDRARSFLKEKM